MNRDTAARARSFVTFCVFALLAVSVVATEAGAGKSAVYGDGADSHLDAPLILGLVGLAGRLDASRIIERVERSGR